MRLFTLFLLAALAAPSVSAASYQKTDGTIVNPFLNIWGEVLPYSGPNLEPGADLIGASLAHLGSNFLSGGFSQR
jgi:hypothetical protein